MLIEKGANITQRNEAGFNSIDKARFKGFKTIAKFLEKKAENSKEGEKQFPPFQIKFDFKKKIEEDEVYENLILKKKHFNSKIKVYPFNDLKGNYYLSIFNYRTYQDMKNDTNLKS